LKQKIKLISKTKEYYFKNRNGEKKKFLKIEIKLKSK
jgi:hypothetical protein